MEDEALEYEEQRAHDADRKEREASARMHSMTGAAKMRELCAAKVEEQGRLLKAIFETPQYDALIRDLAAAIRGISCGV